MTDQELSPTPPAPDEGGGPEKPEPGWATKRAILIAGAALLGVLAIVGTIAVLNEPPDPDGAAPATTSRPSATPERSNVPDASDASDDANDVGDPDETGNAADVARTPFQAAAIPHLDAIDRELDKMVDTVENGSFQGTFDSQVEIDLRLIYLEELEPPASAAGDYAESLTQIQEGVDALNLPIVEGDQAVTLAGLVELQERADDARAVVERAE